jgi:hypothetical protein
MKKIFILLALLGVCTSSFAFLTQSNWRWRNNDGSETTATWKANQSTPITYNSSQEVLRLRIELYNATSDTIALEDSLQYTTTPLVANSWTNISNNPADKAFVMAGANSLVAQDVVTTSQITGNTYVFDSGKVIATDTVLKGTSIIESHRSEFEWAIMGTATTAPNTTYYFRHWGSSANPLPPGITYPSLTTGTTLPLILTGFSLASEGKKVRLEWSTESEENNDRFEVQRSANGLTWETIAKVKGKGTTTALTNYSAYDNSPLPGVNYYRLQQYDINGRSSSSAIKSLKFAFTGSIVMVSPNPARSVINFKLLIEGAKNVMAILSDASGKIVHQQMFKDIQPNSLNKLNFNQTRAGMYILKLKAEGLSESIKVMVQ